MSREQVYSEAPGGGSDRFYLDQFGQLTGLVYDWAYPGGPDTCAFNLACDEHFSHRALAPGRFLAILSGGITIWRGRMEEPTRGVPWQCTGTGIGTMAADWLAITTTGSPGGALALNQIVDNAISRGLPWSRLESLPFASGLNITSGQSTVADVLSQAADLLGTYWTLDIHAQLTMNTPPNGVQYTVLSLSNPGGRSSQGFATSVGVQWVSINTKKTITTMVPNVDAVKQFGTIEAQLDLTSVGSINAGTALAAGQAYLNLRNPRSFFSGQLTLTQGQLCNYGGAETDMATARPGQRMRVHWTDLDPFGEIDPTAPIDLMIGHTSYDSDAETLTITPLDSTLRTLDENRLVHKTHAYHAMREKQKREAAARKRAAARHAAFLRWYKRTHHGHLPPPPKATKPPKRRK